MASSPFTLTKPLEPLLPILDAFIHRHSNQHGATHWFPHVPILRRHLRTFSALSARAAASTSAAARATCDARLVRNTKWFRAKALPRCFLKFSQLAADNQHAALGLLLLSVLAQFNSVLEKIVPPEVPSDPPAQSRTSTAHEKADEKKTTALPVDPARPTSAHDQRDRGTVISRDQIASVPSRKKPASATAAAPKSDVTAAVKPKTEPAPSLTSDVGTKKRKPVEGDKRNKELKIKKKKKTKSGGDAFSDMFGGL